MGPPFPQSQALESQRSPPWVLGRPGRMGPTEPGGAAVYSGRFRPFPLAAPPSPYLAKLDDEPVPRRGEYRPLRGARPPPGGGDLVASTRLPEALGSPAGTRPPDSPRLNPSQPYGTESRHTLRRATSRAHGLDERGRGPPTQPHAQQRHAHAYGGGPPPDRPPAPEGARSYQKGPCGGPFSSRSASATNAARCQPLIT